MSVCHLSSHQMCVSSLDRACWWGRRLDGLRLRLGAQRQDALRHLPAPCSARRRLVSALPRKCSRLAADLHADARSGTPSGMCKETGEGSGVFTREWSKSTVTIDCNAYTSTIKMK